MKRPGARKKVDHGILYGRLTDFGIVAGENRHIVYYTILSVPLYKQVLGLGVIGCQIDLVVWVPFHKLEKFCTFPSWISSTGCANND